ncbi:MAG TPA: Gfo/Idh/MocA family oxidoreductase [Vicinamibacterales bacterium]
MIRRREFLKSSAAIIAASRLSRMESLAAQVAADKRVALIGSGWYGKSDLLRLVQVAPVNVVSLCDPDSRMVSDAADLVASRQASKKRPRTFGDWRKMLMETDLDIVLIDPPDHWHALPMIEAVKQGLDVWVQKPICVDVVEGQAMLAAARKYNRVVQVGLQRRSTPHLVTARDRIIREGKLGHIAYVEIYCYYHMRASENPPDTAAPPELDYEMWTGPAPMRPFNKLTHPRSWRAFMEYGNGIMGDMCVHMLDMVRWMMDLPMPTRMMSSGGIFVDKASKANITDTQTATFEFPDLRVHWTHRTWGDPPDPRAHPWGATFYGDKGTLEASVMGYSFYEPGKKEPSIHEDVVYELDKFPEDRTEKDLERHVAPAIRAHMKNFLEAIGSRQKPVADIEQGYMSTAACILANLSMRLGRSMQWDHAHGAVIGDPEAAALLRRPYRSPWVHPEVDTV